MEYKNRLKRFFKGTEYKFNTSDLKGFFVVKNFKIRKIPFVIHHSNGESDYVLDLTIDLKHCEYFTIGNYWHTPPKGFRKNKTKLNKSLKTLIENEVQTKLRFLGVPFSIEKIKINWLHEPINEV